MEPAGYLAKTMDSMIINHVTGAGAMLAQVVSEGLGPTEAENLAFDDETAAGPHGGALPARCG